MFRIPLLLALALCVSLTAFAQSQANTGNIEGRVTDPNAAAVPNVTVTAATPIAARAQIPGVGRGRGGVLKLPAFCRVAETQRSYRREHAPVVQGALEALGISYRRASAESVSSALTHRRSGQ